MGDHAAAEERHSPRWVALAWVAITAGTVLIVAPHAIVGIILDSVNTVVLLGSAVLLGTAIVPWLGLGPMPRRWHWLLAAAVGIGGLSLLVLAMGLAGVLSRLALTVVLVLMAAIGLWSHRQSLRSAAPGAAPPRDGDPANWSAEERDSNARSPMSWSAMLLLTAPFAGLALAAASNTPGILWSEEGFGYDVLEYHLQAPREYREEGRITYRPHNVYANFPANVEMLYLAAMILVDGDVEAGTTANQIHLALGALAVYAAWVVASEFGRRSGIAAAATLGTCGWLPYLSGMAYVEHGVLFFGIVALGTVLRAWRGGSGRPGGRWFAIGGAIAGLAFGCKYTAGPMVVLPIAVSILVPPSLGFGSRARSALVFCIGAVVAFAPWAVKNVVFTGNPVFPLAQSVFRAVPDGWDTDAQARWDRGHATPPTSVTSAARDIWDMILADHYQRFGSAVFVLAGAAFVVCRRAERSRGDLRALIVVAVVQLAVWVALTHHYARFASVLLIPLPLVASRAFVSPREPRCRILAAILCAGAVWNLFAAWRLHHSESPGGVPFDVFVDGLTPGYEYLAFLNDETPAGARVLLVGDARPFYIQRDVDYCVVFNRNPLADQLRRVGRGGLMHWFEAQRFDYVLVNWKEVDRLSSTYGFPSEISSELFGFLGQQGMQLEREFSAPLSGRRYIEIYKVPHPDTPGQH